VLRLSDVRSRAEADSEQSILDLAARLKQARRRPPPACCAPQTHHPNLALFWMDNRTASGSGRMPVRTSLLPRAFCRAPAHRRQAAGLTLTLPYTRPRPGRRGRAGRGAQVEQELRGVNVRFGTLHGAAAGRELDLFGRCVPGAAPPSEPEPAPTPRAPAAAGPSRLRRAAPASSCARSLPPCPGSSHRARSRACCCQTSMHTERKPALLCCGRAGQPALPC